MNTRRGFTLIELTLVVGIIAVLAGVVIIAVNPGRQFAQARDTKRTSNVRAILDAVTQRIAENGGVFENGCAAGPIPTGTPTLIATGAGNYDIAPCIIPDYISVLPFDPSDPAAHFTSETDYNTGYFVEKDAVTGRVTVSAPSADLLAMISITR